MSRSPSTSPRSPVPPSSFPGGLQPIAASRNDRGGNRLGPDSTTRRTSRIEMSFEQALQAEGTVVIKEGVDFDSLGEDLAPSLKFLSSNSGGGRTSPSLSPHSRSPPTSSSSRPQRLVQEAAATSNMPSPTLTPTPFKSSRTSPNSRPTAPAPASVSTSASSSSNDLFYDAEDPDYQTKRRSMYRSQGTASSPDLATLVRKAKQRATILPPHLVGKDRRHEPTPPLPTGPHAPSEPSRIRHRSSTSSSGHTVPSTITPTSMSKGKLQKSRPTATSSGADGAPTNAGHDDRSVKASVGAYPVARGADSNVEPKILCSAKDERVLGQGTWSIHNP
jgi:hypothetical protein